MPKVFNVTGACRPAKHYMVDLTTRLKEIRKMVDDGDYFTINKARQYGKTTTLRALAGYLKPMYIVVSMDFQRLSTSVFETESSFCNAFLLDFTRKIRLENKLGDELTQSLQNVLNEKSERLLLPDLFYCLSELCARADKPIVLMIDEVDQATNNQVFLDFLAQLRAGYLESDLVPTFQSVILAGVYDIRSLKGKLRPAQEHQENSPWNIAADFCVDMSFSVKDISGMLCAYEEDYHTGMDIEAISGLIYEYTSGYPYLVSRLCKLMDEYIYGSSGFETRAAVWTADGFYEAEKRIVKEDNTLYQSLIGKLKLYPKLRSGLQELLFNGKPIPYVPNSEFIKDTVMFGFVRMEQDTAVISNRIFEAVLYNYFISEEFATNRMYQAGTQERSQFFIGGHINIRRILEKFIEAFDEIYGDCDEKFLEKEGRRYFLLFLKPILNGAGNYSIEPQTRNSERMDLVIYYNGEQNILELKIWRGNSYNERGEKQLSEYLDYFHMKRGYMLSFNFNKNKKTGIQEIVFGDKKLIEAVV